MDFVYYPLLFVIALLGYAVLREQGYKRSKYPKLSGMAVTLARLISRKRIIKLKEEQRKSREGGSEEEQEQPKHLTTEKETDTQTICGSDQQGNSIFVKLALHAGGAAEVALFLRLTNGTTYVLPNEPSVLLCSVQRGKWQAEGLTINILEPYRKIRLLYNGLLRKMFHLLEEEENVEHVKFNFIWSTADKPLFHPEDTTNSLLLHTINSENYYDNDWVRLLNSEKSYDQYGALQGFVTGTAFQEPLTLYFPSFRQRFWGTAHSRVLCRSLTIFVVGEDGTLFSVGTRCYDRGYTQLKYGTLLDSIGNIHQVTNHDIDLGHFGEHVVCDAMTVHLVAKRKTFKCVLHLNHNQIITTRSDALHGWEMQIVPAKCMLGDQVGVALVTFWRSRKGPGVATPRPLLVEPQIGLTYDVVVRFSSEHCRMTGMAGGKGSSLSLLSSLKSPNFVVPEGFVVLAPAFHYHVKQNPKLGNGINLLAEICRGNSEQDLATTCKTVVNWFAETEVDQKVAGDVLNLLKEVGQNNQNRWAVRSSGVNEDCEDLSAAGQNATILGCSSSEDVLKSVSACWGSLFTFQSVQYRRQHGLDINTTMGVVVQRMIPSEKAGVLFTCHPTTGDPSKMVITSNFGLGESVVSGDVDPDTITINRTWDGQLTMHSQHVGAKKSVVQMSAYGVQTVSTPQEKANVLSLTNEEVIRLGTVGVELERAYGSARDIEWAFFEGTLYLLQSRPITTLTTWSDYELLHEFDSPVLTHQELFTVANSGEVLPGATSLLTFSTVCYYVSKFIYRYIMNTTEGPFVTKFLGCNSHHVTINVTNCLLNKIGDKVNKGIKVLDMAVFGHLVVDENIHAVAVSRFGSLTKFGQINVALQSFMEAFEMDAYVKKSTEIAATCNLPTLENLTALEMVCVIDENLYEKSKVFEYHARASTISIFYQMVAINVLAEGSEDLAADHYYDIALLLSSCTNVVSAEVPKILEKIAGVLREAGLSQTFLGVKPEEGTEWLRQHCPAASLELDGFLEKHGHRGFREFDFMFDTWGINPSLVIEMLQANCKSNQTTKPTVNLSPEETVAKLLTPKSNIIRHILKFLVRKCRKSVSQREATKSELIRIVNETRGAFRKLAKQMVLEYIIPEPTLVYHFTLYELKQVIQNRDPRLVHKAIRRQRLHGQWDRIKMPELIFGFAKVEEEDVLCLDNDRVRLSGTPVCLGNAIGRACVITSLEEIGQLQPGDILITYSTDVGWTPYFPILAAVVTEIGGIISHGAVVAREYGLPCVVGVKNATKLFKTGDKVVLSGRLGVVELAPKCETD